jgi:hypothetical protein
LPVLFGLLVVFATERAEAYPWMIKHGYANCSGCHADPSGGELLTFYGHSIAAEALSTKWGGSSEAARADERRVMAAVQRAARAKNAPKKKIAAEKVDLDEPASGKAPAAKTAAPAAKAAAPAAANADAAGGKVAAAKKPAEDSEEAAEEEAPAEGEASAEAAAAETSGETPSDEASAAPAAEGTPFDGMGALVGPLFGLYRRPTETLLLGGSWRFASLFRPSNTDKKFTFFPMQLDLYGQLRIKSFRLAGSIGAAKVPAGSPHARPAQVTANQGDGYNLISRTFWAGYDFGPGGAHTVRVGRLNLPFGIRMSEHVMWVRDKTQTDRESDQQYGAALAVDFQKVRAEVMGIAGNLQISAPYRELGYSGYGEFMVADSVALGVNSLMTVADNDRTNPEGLKTARGAHGLFMRAGASDKVAFLVEADIMTRSRRQLGYVGFLQVDTELFQGFHAIATGEFYDMGWSGGPTGLAPRSKGQGQPALGGWLSVQWFFLTHFDFRIDALIRSEKQLMGQLHVYL